MKKSNNGKAKPPKAQPKSGAKLGAKPVPITKGAGATIRNQPKQRMLPNGDIIVSHRELAGPLLASGSSFYRGLSLTINAGNALLFPWLANLARQYESYNFSALRFDFRPQVPTTYAGEVWLTCDYDAKDAPPANQAAASVTPGSSSGAVSTPVTMICRAQDLNKRKTYYVRTVGDGGASVSGVDQRSFDVGIFYAFADNVINAAGAGFNSSVGPVWVSYTVRLSTPQSTGASAGMYLNKAFNMATAAGGYQNKISTRAALDANNKAFEDDLTNVWSAGSAPVVGTYTGPLLAIAKSVIKNPEAQKIINVANVVLQNGVEKQPAVIEMTYPDSATALATTLNVLDVVPGDTLDVQTKWTNSATLAAAPLMNEYVSFTTIPPSLRTALSTLVSAYGSRAITNPGGFNAYFEGTGAMTAATPLGVPVVRGDTTRFPYDTATGVLSFGPGMWVLTLNVVGTGLNPPSFGPVSGTLLHRSSIVNTAATECVCYVAWSSAVNSTIDLSLTAATTITSSYLWLCPEIRDQDYSLASSVDA